MCKSFVLEILRTKKGKRHFMLLLTMVIWSFVKWFWTISLTKTLRITKVRVLLRLLWNVAHLTRVAVSNTDQPQKFGGGGTRRKRIQTHRFLSTLGWPRLPLPPQFHHPWTFYTYFFSNCNQDCEKKWQNDSENNVGILRTLKWKENFY